MQKAIGFLLLGLSFVITACETRQTQAASTSAIALASSAATVNASTTSESKANVAKIIFVGKEQACDCTRKKIETAQAALQKLLGEPPRIPIESLQADTQEAEVEAYRKLRPMLALPAIYFIDSAGSLVEMLQGEISEAQVSKALGSP